MNVEAVLPVKSSRGLYNVEFNSTFEQVVRSLVHFLECTQTPSMVILFSNPLVYSLYGETLLQELRKVIVAQVYLFPDGEEHKRLETIANAIHAIDQYPIDRQATFIALGGGVVGDMTGFLASIFVRGVNWIQIPTTLLSMVDSSVGGKTGVNLASGKNRLGTFYPPDFVCSSPEVLRTLSRSQVVSGFGEVFKHCLLGSKDLVERFLTDLIPTDERPDSLPDPDFIHVVCAVKAQVVEQDELEKGLRMVLNLGHTIGHALESLCCYEGLLHGEAVLLGMWAEIGWTHSKGWTEDHVLEKIEFVCKNIDMSIEIRDNISIKTMFDAISFDKKMQCDKLQMVVLQDFGKAMVCHLEQAEIADMIEFVVEFLKQKLSHLRS